MSSSTNTNADRTRSNPPDVSNVNNMDTKPSNAVAASLVNDVAKNTQQSSVRRTPKVRRHSAYTAKRLTSPETSHAPDITRNAK